MQSTERLHFYNPTCGKLNFEQVIEEIFDYMRKDPQKNYEIVAGCDSSSDERPAFPVAIVILKKGYGGRFFLTRIQYPRSAKRKFYNWHQRILEEVVLSCEIGLRSREALKEKINSSKIPLNYQFQYIHADVGPKGVTRDMIREVVGLIRSNGFEAKIKPEAFAASVVADRFS